MGHEDIRTTFDTYGHLFPDREEDLVAALDARKRRAPAPVKFRYPDDKSGPVPRRHSAEG
jgi:hypothetical protein